MYGLVTDLIVFVVLPCLLIYRLRKYFCGGVCRCTNKMYGKTVVITGATSGVGKETALELARRGARVFMGIRNSKLGEKVAREIVSSTGNPDVFALRLDLCSFKSVRNFVDQLKSKTDAVNVLINNAGAFCQPYAVTEDGYELIYQTNYLGHFLLTYLLQDAMASQSRIINLTSIIYEKCKAINYEDNSKRETYDHFRVYAMSKMAVMLFTHKLAQDLKEFGVSVFSVHPGLVDTDICKNMPFMGPGVLRTMVYPLIRLIYKDSNQGAQTTIHCAVAEGLDEKTGSYFKDCKEHSVNERAKNDAEAEKLWEMSLEMVSEKNPEYSKVNK